MPDCHVPENPCPVGKRGGNRLSRSQVESVEAALAAGASNVEAARLCGVGIGVVSQIRYGQQTLQKKRGGFVPRWTQDVQGRRRPPSYLPTPEEIEAACLAIRMAKPDPEPQPWLCPGWEYGNPAPY